MTPFDSLRLGRQYGLRKSMAKSRSDFLSRCAVWYPASPVPYWTSCICCGRTRLCALLLIFQRLPSKQSHSPEATSAHVIFTHKRQPARPTILQHMSQEPGSLSEAQSILDLSRGYKRYPRAPGSPFIRKACRYRYVDQPESGDFIRKEVFFPAHKVFRRYQRTLGWRFWQDAAVGMGLSPHSVCRTGAGRCMKIGDRQMVSQGTRRRLLVWLL